MKIFFKILLAVLAAFCIFKGVQIMIDLLYDKYGKKYIQSEEF